MQDERPVMVTVYAVAYNHAKYIRQALDGMVMQKTDFRFEILVHDDASTDETADIIREYEAKYPELIRPIYQKENLHSRQIPRNKNYLLPMTRGKYIAWCECDDFWTDPLKLQKQFDALEAHPDCCLCVGRVKVIMTDEGSSKCWQLPDFELATGIKKQDEFLRLMKTYSFQTSTYFIVTDIFRELYTHKPEFANYTTVDVAILLFSATKGSVYYIDDQLSCYRWSSDGSFTSNFWSKPLEKSRNHYLKNIEARKLFDEFTGGRFHDVLESHIDVLNKLIVKLEFKFAEKNKDYKTMIQKKYAEFHPYWKKRDYCFVWLMAYCPWLMNTLRSVKNLLKGKIA